MDEKNFYLIEYCIKFVKSYCIIARIVLHYCKNIRLSVVVISKSPWDYMAFVLEADCRTAFLSESSLTKSTDSGSFHVNLKHKVKLLRVHH
jgi:hypothetical protein